MTPVSVSVQIFLQDSAFNSLGHILRSGIAGSNDNSILNCLRKHHTVFSQVLYLFIFLKTVHKGSNLHQHLVFSGFFNSNHPNGCEVVYLEIWILDLP